MGVTRAAALGFALTGWWEERGREGRQGEGTKITSTTATDHSHDWQCGRVAQTALCINGYAGT